MGIRPHLSLVFGIDNFPWPAGVTSLAWEGVTKAEIANDPYLELALGPNPDLEWADILYRPWGDGSVNQGVFGYRVGESYGDSSLLRALFCVVPMFANLQSGRVDIPFDNEADYSVSARRLRSSLLMEFMPPGIEWQTEWFYPRVIEDPKMWPIYAYLMRRVISHYLPAVDYRSFKLMLVWDWS